MPLFDMFGGPVTLSFVEILQVLYNWRTLGFVALMATAVFGADPHDYRGHMPIVYAFLLWQVGAMALVLIKTVTFFCLSLLTARFRSLRIWLPIFSFIEFTLALFVLLAMDRHVVDATYSFDVWATYPFIMTTMLILELIYVRFLMASIVEPQKAEQRLQDAVSRVQSARTTPPALRTIEIAGRKLRLDTIRYITSEEHYVRVVTRSEEIVARAKLPTVTEGSTEPDGIRTHRSWWISRHANPVLRRRDGKYVVDLGEGVLAPVARSRAKEVQDWFDSHVA